MSDFVALVYMIGIDPSDICKSTYHKDKTKTKQNKNKQRRDRNKQSKTKTHKQKQTYEQT
jgi:hypothetical protein